MANRDAENIVFPSSLPPLLPPRKDEVTLRQCERLLALEARLEAVLHGKDKPADPAQLSQLAQLCLVKKWYAAGARLYGEALAVDHKLANDLHAGHRYHAACAAALAATGKDSSAATFDRERPGLRQQALNWLRADLGAWAKATNRAGVRQTLARWQTDPNLAGLRDKEALAKLPEADRDAWRKFWADVADPQQKGGGKE
jgi:hypothetical protein